MMFLGGGRVEDSDLTTPRDNWMTTSGRLGKLDVPGWG